MAIQYYKDRVCLNFLAGSIDNAKELYEVAEGNAVIGVLSSNYSSLDSAIADMNLYMEALDGNLSIGLGSGNPDQWKFVGDLTATIKANHVNQVFTGVGYTLAKANNKSMHINSLISPSGIPGLVNISTGPQSSKAIKPALVSVETAIAMVKDMGGQSLKFFPMQGLQTKDELQAIAKACAANDFGLEPTGGINLENYEEIMKIILDAGVKKVIPHIYSSIIDKETGETRVRDVKTLLKITKNLLD